MIDASAIRKGNVLQLNGTLWRVMDAEYNKPGRGTASMRTVLKDMNTGSIQHRVFNAEERVEDVRFDSDEVTYLYNDGTFYNIMNNRTYEQYELARDFFGDDAGFLKENMTFELSLHEGKPVAYNLPTTVDYVVAEAENAVAGDSSGRVLKVARTESGLSVQVPLFVNEGDTIRVDTRDGSYVTRV